MHREGSSLRLGEDGPDVTLRVVSPRIVRVRLETEGAPYPTPSSAASVSICRQVSSSMGMPSRRRSASRRASGSPGMRISPRRACGADFTQAKKVATCFRNSGSGMKRSTSRQIISVPLANTPVPGPAGPVPERMPPRSSTASDRP